MWLIAFIVACIESGWLWAVPPSELVQTPRTFVLDDALFDLNQTQIKPDGAKILDRLVLFLNENLDKGVDLRAYTSGAKLGQRSQPPPESVAALVRNYLVGKGIDPSRITTNWRQQPSENDAREAALEITILYWDREFADNRQ